MTRTQIALALLVSFLIAGSAFGFANVAVVTAVIVAVSAVIGGLAWINYRTGGLIGFLFLLDF